MATVGEQLKAAREARHLSVHRVAEVTKMRSDHVLALEEGNYRVFVAPVYTRGFVRSYARLVKLDEAGLLAQLDRELGGQEPARRSVEPFEAERPDRGEWWRWIRGWRWRVAGPVGAGVILAVGVFVLIQSWRSGAPPDPLAGLEPGLYRGAETGVTLPLPARNRAGE